MPMTPEKISWRGGAWIGLWQVSWPFATLSVSANHLVLRAWPYRIKLFTLSARISGIRIIPFIATGVRIHHERWDVPQFVIFWAPVWHSNSLLEVFKSHGYHTA